VAHGAHLKNFSPKDVKFDTHGAHLTNFSLYSMVGVNCCEFRTQNDTDKLRYVEKVSMTTNNPNSRKQHHKSKPNLANQV
jgi:hypothetical protein